MNTSLLPANELCDAFVVTMNVSHNVFAINTDAFITTTNTLCNTIIVTMNVSHDTFIVTMIVSRDAFILVIQ